MFVWTSRPLWLVGTVSTAFLHLQFNTADAASWPTGLLTRVQAGTCKGSTTSNLLYTSSMR